MQGPSSMGDSTASGEDVVSMRDVLQTGWMKPIELDEAEYSQPLGLANSPISGTDISQIVTNPNVSVRADGNSCVSCHGGPGSLRPEWTSSTQTQTSFCQLVPSFLNADKPQVLKEVFAAWAAQGCPL